MKGCGGCVMKGGVGWGGGHEGVGWAGVCHIGVGWAGS